MPDQLIDFYLYHGSVVCACDQARYKVPAVPGFVSSEERGIAHDML